jgi:hypothetical protein
MGNLPPGLVPSGQGDGIEARLMELAGSLERAAAAYGTAVDLVYKTEVHAPAGPWIASTAPLSGPTWQRGKRKKPQTPASPPR